jgi:hypothetical protein
MPPGPLVNDYILRWTYIPYVIENNQVTFKPRMQYRAEIRWAAHAAVLAKLVDKQQIWHRSRAIALAVDVLRINEMNRRLNQFAEYKAAYEGVALKDRESQEANQVVIEETLRHFHLDYEHIGHYIRDHMRSSLGGGGVKWRQALAMTRDEWKLVLERLKTNLEQGQLHPTWYPANFPQSGERARSLALGKQMVNLYPSQGNWAEVDRTRIILFGNYMSLYTVFIRDKASWYKTVLEKFLDIVKPEGEYHFPFMLGGQVYRLFSDMHKTKLPFHAYDGKAWDTGAGKILGPYFNWLLVPIGGVSQVASGQSHTSMLDTLAIIAASRNLPGTKICLGDDLNHWGTSTIHTPILEMDPADTEYRFNLGMSYWHDPDVPRISGFKVTKDRSVDMRSIQSGDFQEFEAAYGSKRSAEQRVLHAGMYLGQFGKGTLLERIEKLPPNNWKSPGELMDSLIDEGEPDTWRWADEHGVKEVFL